MGIQDWFEKRKTAKQRKENEAEKRLSEIDENIKRVEDMNKKINQTSTIDPRLYVLGKLKEYEASSTARRVELMEHMMVKNQANEILSAYEEQNPGFRESLRVDINPEEQKREQEKMEKQRRRQEYIKTHPYAQIMEELLKHVKAKEEGKGNVYSGTSRESILAQYRMDNGSSIDNNIFIPYICELAQAGCDFETDVPKDLVDDETIKIIRYRMEPLEEQVYRREIQYLGKNSLKILHNLGIIDLNNYLSEFDFIKEDWFEPYKEKVCIGGKGFRRKFEYTGKIISTEEQIDSIRSDAEKEYSTDKTITTLPKEYEKFIQASNTR